MSRLNWDKANKKSLMRRHGAEPATRIENVSPPEGWTPFGPPAKLPLKRAKVGVAPPKSRKKASQQGKTAARTFAFLHEVVRCELLEIAMPEIPAKLRQDLEQDVELLGGALAWARRQPRYDIVRQKKAKKLGIEIAEPAAHPSPRQSAASPDTELLAATRTLTGKQKSLRELLSKAQDELDRMDEDLRLLRRLAALPEAANSG